MLQGELELFKPGKGAFYATELQDWLQARHITHLLFAGVTTEVRPDTDRNTSRRVRSTYVRERTPIVTEVVSKV